MMLILTVSSCSKARRLRQIGSGCLLPISIYNYKDWQHLRWLQAAVVPPFAWSCFPAVDIALLCLSGVIT